MDNNRGADKQKLKHRQKMRFTNKSNSGCFKVKTEAQESRVNR